MMKNSFVFNDENDVIILEFSVIVVENITWL